MNFVFLIEQIGLIKQRIFFFPKHERLKAKNLVLVLCQVVKGTCGLGIFLLLRRLSRGESCGPVASTKPAYSFSSAGVQPTPTQLQLSPLDGPGNFALTCRAALADMRTTKLGFKVLLPI